MCARVGNQWSCGVVTARVRIDAIRSLRHQRQDLHQLTYPVPLGRSGLIILSSVPASSIYLLFLQEAHGCGLMRHFGVKKIDDVLTAHFFWQKMRCNVERYVLWCTTYNKAKSRLNPHDLYMSLLVHSVH
jgi:hypothetical protein